MRGAWQQSHFREEIRKLRLQGLINRMRFTQLASGKAVLHRQPPGWWIGPFQFRWQEIMQKEDKRLLGPSLISCNYPVHYRKLVFYSEWLYFFSNLSLPLLCKLHSSHLHKGPGKIFSRVLFRPWKLFFPFQEAPKRQANGNCALLPWKCVRRIVFQNRSRGEDIGPRAWEQMCLSQTASLSPELQSRGGSLEMNGH